MDLWYTSHTTLVEVASHALSEGSLSTAEEMLYFFEKPWKYEEMYEAWANSLVAK